MSQQAFTPLDQFKLNSASEIQMAPNCEWLVYVRHSFDIDTDTQLTRLWRINGDGSDHRLLTGDDAQEATPRIASCGQRVAFVSNASGQMQIHVYDIATGINKPVTEGFMPPSQPSWSPDGEHIAYFAPAMAPAPDFGNISAAPENSQWAEPPQIITRLPYKIDRLGYLPNIFQQLHVAPSAGGASRQLTDGEFDHIVFLAPQNPIWTPDGKELLICTNPDEPTQLNGRAADLFSVPLKPSAMRQVTRFEGGVYHPAIAPDGKRIAFLGFKEDGACHPQLQLHVMNIDGSDIVALANDLDRSLGESLDNGGAPLQFSADGKSVFCLYSDCGNTKLGQFDLDGSHKVVAQNLGAGLTAYASLSSFGVLDDGGVVFNRALGNALPELYVQGTIDSAAKPITNFNGALSNARSIGEIEELWCKNPEDGLAIQGWLIRAPGTEADTKLPLILDIHGGPHADYGNRFWIRNQAMAAAGYSVLLVNPRGSTSYGHAFTRGIEHCYPGPDVGDLLAAVDECVARGWADPDALYVMGGSGGGTLTAACVARTDRFRAAACLYPVIDWSSLVLTADITPFMRHWRSALPWEAQQEFWQHSLIREIEKVATPTIVMCGSEDHRTPFYQAEMFYQALKFRGVDTALVRFNGEGHGMSSRPSHAVQTAELVLNWFKKYA